MEPSYTPDIAALIDGDEETHAEAYSRGRRDGYRRALEIMNAWAYSVIRSNRPKLTTFQIASALGLTAVEGKSDAEIATLAGVSSRACISKGRIEFQRATGIKPLPGQKSESARETYSLNH